MVHLTLKRGFILTEQDNSHGKQVTCTDCKYTWITNFKRPNPRFITCPNCRENVELRESKLD